MQKITLTTETRRCINPNTFLGYEGENNANKLIFEFTDGFIDGLAVLKVERGETKGTIDLVKVEETYELEVKSSLLAVQGDIKFQFVITEPDGTITKYDPFIMTVKDALDADGELPEEYPSWQEIIATELAKVEKATENANKVAEDLIEAQENGEFNGKNGVSPMAKVERISNGAKITVTDINGTTTAEVYDGEGTEVEIPTKVSQLENDAGFATESFVKNEIANAQLGGSSGGAVSGIPVGMIISHFGTKAPEGYLVCDGKEYNISDYPNLANHFLEDFGSVNFNGGDGSITFAVPDMRNEFLRGYHGDAEIPLSGEIGVHQEATWLVKDSITYSSNKPYYATFVNKDNTTDDLSTLNADGMYTVGSIAKYKTSAMSSVNTAGLTNYIATRPTNMAVLFCIKY